MGREKMDINYKKLLIAGVTGGIINILYSIAVCENLILPFLNPITGSDYWVPNTPAHIAIMAVFSICACIIWAFGFAVFYKAIPGSGIAKGISYGFLLWFIAILPQTVALQLHTKMWAEFNWVFLSVNSLVRWIILGIVFSLIYKGK
jgi:hypothetical protein